MLMSLCINIWSSGEAEDLRYRELIVSGGILHISRDAVVRSQEAYGDSVISYSISTLYFLSNPL